jgi:hypothetical protein
MYLLVWKLCVVHHCGIQKVAGGWFEGQTWVECPLSGLCRVIVSNIMLFDPATQRSSLEDFNPKCCVQRETLKTGLVQLLRV